MISQLQPEHDTPPAFSQIYIYDDEEQLSKGLKNFNGLDKELLGELQKMMKDINPYAGIYKHIGDVMQQNPGEDIQLVLKTGDGDIDP